MARHIFDRILSLEEASQRSGISSSWLRRLVDDGRLPAKKVGKTWLVLEEDVDALAAQERPRGPRVKTLTSQVGGRQLASMADRKLRAAQRQVRQ